MIFKIARTELLLNLMTFKFAVGTIICVILMAVFMPVLVSDYQQRLKDYNQNVAANEAILRNVRVYKNITPTVYRWPSVLSVFSEGLEKRLGNSAKIEPESIPQINMTVAEDNPFLSIFPSLDVSLIFKIVLSLLVLLFAYDAVSGEREQGTLKLIMSGSLPRYHFLLGKILAGLITLAVPVTVAFIIGLLILEFSPMVDLTRSDWVRIGLIYIGSLIFISAMYNIGLLFSALAKESAVSLMLALLFWVVCAIVIPDASVRLAAHIQPLQPREKIESEVESAMINLKRNEWPKMRQQLVNLTRGWISSREGSFGRYYVGLIDRNEVEYRMKYYVLNNSFSMKCADKTWEIERGYLDSLLKQKKLVENVSRISPISLYGNVMSAISGSDLAGFQSFIDGAKAYRNQLFEYIRTKTDNLTLPSYFTACTEGEMREYEAKHSQLDNINNEAEKKKVSEAFIKWVKDTIERQPSLGLQDLPKFSYQSSVLSGLQRAALDIGLLMFINVLFLALSFIAFVRYDVRSD
jgi:ABC-type transport system involved in multi-copper enzyme maturation permease subunit